MKSANDVLFCERMTRRRIRNEKWIEGKKSFFAVKGKAISEMPMHEGSKRPEGAFIALNNLYLAFQK